MLRASHPRDWSYRISSPLCSYPAIAIRHTMSSQPSTLPAASPKAVEAGLSIQASSEPSASSRSPMWPAAPGGLKDYLMTQVNPDLSTIPLAAYCFMTGWMCVALASSLILVSFRSLTLCINFFLYSDAVCFSAIFVWCGFQTGNSLQVTSSFLSPPAYCQPQRPLTLLFTSVEPRSSRSRSPAFSRVLLAIATHHFTSRINKLSPR